MNHVRNIFLALLFSSSNLYAQDDTLVIDTLTNDNLGLVSVSENATGLIEQLAKKDNLLRQSRLFFCGELHYFENNWDLKLSFAKFFQSNYGVKRILIEYPVSYACLYNEYLLNGNKRVIRYLPDITSDTLNEHMFLEKLREYNLSLPENKRIQVLGIDVEKNAIVSFQELFKLFPSQITSRKIKKNFRTISKWQKKTWVSDKKTKKIVRVLHNALYGNETEFKEHFKDNYNAYKRIIDGLHIGFDAPYTIENPEFLEIREQFIYSNIKDYLNENPSEIFFGQIGLAHSALNADIPELGAEPGFRSAAYRLNTQPDSPVKNKVCSFMQFYTQYDDSLYQQNFLFPHTEQLLLLAYMKLALFDFSDFSFENPILNERGQFLIINKNNLGPYMH